MLVNGDEIPSESSDSIDEDWYPFIYGSTGLENLTYYPPTIDFHDAYISSDHDFYCHHYYEDESFNIEYEALLAVWEDFDFYFNPIWHTSLGEYDSETQAMPTDYLDDEVTLWVNLAALPADPDGTDYNMFAYTRMKATPDGLFDADATFFYWESKSFVEFTHRPPPQ